MKNLSDVELSLEEYDKNDDFFFRFLLVVATTTPKLQRLTLNKHLDSPYIINDFVKWVPFEIIFSCVVGYSKKIVIFLVIFMKKLWFPLFRYMTTYFPDVNLTLPIATMFEPPSCWSKNLHVEQLHITSTVFIAGNEHGLQSLVSIPLGISVLYYTDVTDPETVYRLLEKHGKTLRSLQLTVAPSRVKINLHRILSLCSNLEELIFYSAHRIVNEPRVDLAPNQFAKFKNLQLLGDSNW
jgi:hypothetical protein